MNKFECRLPLSSVLLQKYLAQKQRACIIFAKICIILALTFEAICIIFASNGAKLLIDSE